MHIKMIDQSKVNNNMMNIDTRLSCFNVKTNCVILKIRKNYFQLKMFFSVNKKGLGKKFERKKVRIGEKVELFSIRTFFLKLF